MLMVRVVAALVLATVGSFYAWADEQGPEPQTIVAPIYASDNPKSNNHYFVRLLVLVLDKTVPSHGPYRLVEPEGYLVDDRLRAALSQGLVDVVWFNTYPEAEAEFHAIKEPLLGEINRYRLLLIRRGDQARFSAVQSLDDLRQLHGGIGAQWVDAKILEANKLPYVTAPRYSSLFRMLAAGRFDYFSRGLYQIKQEVDLYPELDLAIEENLMLHYPNKSYFFVAHGNTALAERLRQGIQLARKDGSFAELFDSVPQYRWAREVLEKQREHQTRSLLYLDYGSPSEDSSRN